MRKKLDLTEWNRTFLPGFGPGVPHTLSLAALTRAPATWPRSGVNAFGSNFFRRVEQDSDLRGNGYPTTLAMSRHRPLGDLPKAVRE